LNRLKVSLRRQSRLEDEIEQSRLQIESLKGQLAEREDYKAVEQEKHQLFAQRILELQEINDQLSALSKQQMEQIELLQSDKARNDKYHDKIKNQVRPYIEQLKAFSEQIQQKNKNLENQLNIKTVQINELKTQIDSLAENLLIQSVAQAQQNSELIQSYEAELEFKSSVIADLQNKITELTNQNKKLMQAFDRQVEVENQLIETQRLFETQKKISKMKSCACKTRTMN
jgi:chromosome segregation ATPase